MSKQQSMLITLEGINCVGKTTAIQDLITFFMRKNIPFLATREIGGNAFCEKLRQLSFDEKLTPMTQLLLTLTARIEHVEKVIKPALTEGKTVICDRFSDSTYIYQGVLHGIPNSVIQSFEINLGLDSFKPHITFLLDASNKVLKQRIQARNRGCRYDTLTDNEMSKMRAEYHKRAANEPDRFYTFNTESPEYVDKMIAVLESYYG